MSKTFTGGCACGAIRYACDGEPVYMGKCHCRDCQRATGSAFEAVVAVPEAAVTMQGTPKVYVSKGDTGNDIRRSFCPDCGGTLMSSADIMPNVVMLTTGTLDDSSQFKPSMQIYCDSAQPWVDLQGDIKRFPKMPMPG